MVGEPGAKSCWVDPELDGEIQSTGEPVSGRTGERELRPDAHENAAEAFVERASECDAVCALYLYGPTVRGEAEGLGSDVDVLAVVRDDADRPAVSTRFRDAVFEVMVEHGPVVNLTVFSESTFERYRERRGSIVHTAVTEGRTYA